MAARPAGLLPHYFGGNVRDTAAAMSLEVQQLRRGNLCVVKHEAVQIGRRVLGDGVPVPERYLLTVCSGQGPNAPVKEDMLVRKNDAELGGPHIPQHGPSKGDMSGVQDPEAAHQLISTSGRQPW